MPFSKLSMREIHDHLRVSEKSIDDSLGSIFALSGAITGARTPEVPFGVGQGVMADAAEAINLVTRARHHIARMHARMLEDAQALGIDPTAHGDVFDTPPAKPSGELHVIRTPKLREAA